MEDIVIELELLDNMMHRAHLTIQSKRERIHTTQAYVTITEAINAAESRMTAMRVKQPVHMHSTVKDFPFAPTFTGKLYCGG